jgi:hypothetical protein
MKTGNYRRIYLLILFYYGGLLDAQSVKAPFIGTPPKIDGMVNESIWQQGTVISEFFQREPNTGKPVSEKTIAYIYYDSDYLYFAFECYDDPKKLTAKEIARDASLQNEDKIVIMLDTFLDRRNAYWFEINPRGSKGDALFSQNGAVMNKEWDGIWLGKSSITNQGWQAEFAIPFKSLNFHPHQSVWGLKLQRAIQHKNENAFWPIANINAYEYQVSDAGDLTGLEDITQGIGLDIRPFVLAGIEQKRNEKLDYDTDLGLDVFYQILPGLKGVLTINTDFAQTEVDDRQINLTRFQLFFPEKRDFFLDGAHYFKFAVEADGENPKSNQLVPFFSRRIGLSASGSPTPIVGGIKVTGQAGRWNIGILDVLDQRESGNQNFIVARISHNIGSQSAIGVIGTSGNALDSRSNSIFGGDLKLATSTFNGDKNLTFLLYALKSSTDSLSGKEFSFGADLNYPNDFLFFRFGYMEIGDAFNAGVGFVPRLAIRNSYGELGLAPRPKKWGILQYTVKSDFDYVTDLNNRLLTREVQFTPASFRFLSGETAEFEFSHQYEYLEDDFNIYDSFIIPKGVYEFLRKELRLSTAQRRIVWASTGYEWGPFWNGQRDQIEIAAGYKISVPIGLSFAFEQNKVSLPDGAFLTRIYRSNIDILFNSDITLKNYFQYDSESQRIGWQSRFRWIFTPGNELIFVFNSLWQDPLEHMNPHLKDFSLAESTSQIKLNYNYRF